MLEKVSNDSDQGTERYWIKRNTCDITKNRKKLQGKREGELTFGGGSPVPISSFYAKEAHFQNLSYGKQYYMPHSLFIQ